MQIGHLKENISFEEINFLAEKVGWGELYYPTKARWENALSLSSHIAYIKKNENLIAFGRIIEDGQMCMFYDICVHPDYQREKLGTAVMNFLIDKIKNKNYASIGLFVWPGNRSAAEFYRSFGFEIVTAMELKREMKKI